MAVLRLLLSSLPVDKVGQPRYTRLMRVVELRVLMALVLVLFETMVIVGLISGISPSTMILQGQTSTYHWNSQGGLCVYGCVGLCTRHALIQRPPALVRLRD